MKFEANIEAVILRQSVQLQMKVSTRLSPSTGCTWCGQSVNGKSDMLSATNNLDLHGAAVACCSSRMNHLGLLARLW